MTLDVVCGREVERRGAEREGLIVERHGKTYAFCSKSCKDRFEAQPERYAGADPVAPDGKTSERYAG
jgi:YHS domain-containing protein